MQMFYGQVDAESGEIGRHRLQPEKWKSWFYLILLTFGFWLQSLVLPIFPLIFCLSCCSQCCWPQDSFPCFINDPKELPYVTFYSSMIGYLAFLGFLIAHIMVDNTERNFTWIDWIILLYIAAMIADVFYEIVTRRGRYLTITNVICVITTLLFGVYYFIRGYGSLNTDLKMLRISEHLFALAAGLSCLRLMYYLQFTPKLGPIKAALEEIITVVLSFMIILGIVLVSFGVTISGVYNAGIYTTEYRNGSISLPRLVEG